MARAEVLSYRGGGATSKYIAAAAHAAGDVVLTLEGLAGVATHAAAIGDEVEVLVEGVVEVAAGAEHVVGAKVDWDLGDNETKADGGGDFALGIMERAVGSGGTVAFVRLNSSGPT